MKQVCVFCGSNTGRNPVFVEAAASMGSALVAAGLGVVYGGGNIGLMGVLADAVLARGGKVTGVIPQALVDKELAHGGLTELHVVGSMHERKALMAELADGFIALPGGYGTLEEFCEILTWAQLGLHRKPCGLLNTAAFYEPFLAQIERAIHEGFIPAQHGRLMVVGTTPGELLEQMRQHHAPNVPKWIGPEET